MIDLLLRPLARELAKAAVGGACLRDEKTGNPIRIDNPAIQKEVWTPCQSKM
jgi:hypothetical protein